jgi:glyoxylase-like metal-dependent hydrolase (beta-lactamase superfamily II)
VVDDDRSHAQADPDIAHDLDPLAQACAGPRPQGLELDFPLAPPAPDGSVVQVAEGLLWARMPMPMGLDHINIYLLQDGDGWLAIDTGLALPRTRELWERLVATALGGARLTGLLCTHFHYDHAGLAAWMQARFDIPLWMTLGEFHTLRTLWAPTLPQMPHEPQMPPHQAQYYHRAGLAQERAQHLFDTLRQDRFVSTAPVTFRRVRHGDVMTIDGRPWQVLVGEGHSPEHACLFDAQRGLLIAGDQLLPRISSNLMVSPTEPDADPLGCWFKSLDQLDTLPEDTLVLPSHDEVFCGVQRRTRMLRWHHRRTLDRLGERLMQGREAGGCSALQAMAALYPRLRGPMDEVLALGETLAHLNWLQVQGHVTRSLDGEGVYRYG